MQNLTEFISFVESNPISIEEVRKIIAGQAPLVGDRDNYSIFLNSNFDVVDIEHFDYRLVMSIETSPSKTLSCLYKCRRMSICSRSGEYRMDKIIDLCYILGFTGDSQTWMYKFIETPIHNMDITQLMETI